MVSPSTSVFTLDASIVILYCVNLHHGFPEEERRQLHGITTPAEGLNSAKLPLGLAQKALGWSPFCPSEVGHLSYS